MDITIILPIHEYNECVNDAIKSVEAIRANHEAEFIISTTKEVSEKIGYSDCRYVTVEEGESTSFSHLLNMAVNEVKTKYFSILEMDDVYTPKYFNNVERYYDSGVDASVFLPLTMAVDYEKKCDVGYINEAVLASSFSEELGFLDFDSTENFPSFNFTGGIFNKEDYLESGGLKESMLAFFWHEFSLRLLHHGKRIFVIPKVGYKHTINRKGSLYYNLDQAMNQLEADFWFDTAKKEYFYKNDRNKTYEE